MSITTMHARDFRAKALAGMTEKDWLDQVVTFARHRGWLTYHTFDSRKSVAGFPDLAMVRVLPGGDRRIVFAELKSVKGHASKFQREWLNVLGLVADVSHGSVEVHLWNPSQWPEVRKCLL